MSKRQRVQSSKSTASVFEVLNPEGFRVHTCKSRSDAYRVAAKFDSADNVRHTVRLASRLNVREG